MSRVLSPATSFYAFFDYFAIMLYATMLMPTLRATFRR